MKYIIMDENKGDLFTKEYNTAEEAIKQADIDWNHLTDREKEKRTAFFVLESVNPDALAMDHYDGNPIKVYK